MSSIPLFASTVRLLQSAAGTMRDFAPVATRVVLGHAFILTGLGKWQHFDRTVEFFGSIGIPLPAVNAAFIATLELVGGAALVLGLGVRVVSALLASTMVVALLTADAGRFASAFTRGSQVTPLDVTPLVFLLLLIHLVGFGGGPLSIASLRRMARRSVEGDALRTTAA
jgi:putative oxidoreductase